MKRKLCIGLLIAALLCLSACGPETEGPSVERTSAEIAPTQGSSPLGIPAAATPGTGDSGEEDIVTLVIPEGFTFYQIARRLEVNGVCTAAALTEAAQAYRVQSFDVPDNPQACYRLEGLLYPDTYDFYVGEAPDSVLRKMLNNYAEKSGLPDYDLLILASIIERETRSDAHMAMVSSVFHNRLAQGMRLQADATIAYVEEHIKQDPLVQNPGQYAERYNTYRCPALPAGPICNPSLRAIEAAKNPSQSDYLYYFFGQDETNHYTKSYNEHLAAIKIYGLG